MIKLSFGIWRTIFHKNEKARVEIARAFSFLWKKML